MNKDIFDALRWNVIVFGVAAGLPSWQGIIKLFLVLFWFPSELAESPHFLQSHKPSRWIEAISCEKLLCSLDTYGKYALENVLICLTESKCRDFLAWSTFSSIVPHRSMA